MTHSGKDMKYREYELKKPVYFVVCDVKLRFNDTTFPKEQKYGKAVAGTREFEKPDARIVRKLRRRAVVDTKQFGMMTLHLSLRFQTTLHFRTVAFN